jgi:hypothetical protein
LCPRQKKWKNMQGRLRDIYLLPSNRGSAVRHMDVKESLRSASRSNSVDHVLGSASWPWSRWSSQRGVWPNRCINPSLGAWLRVLPSEFEGWYASLSCSLVVLCLFFDCLSGLRVHCIAWVELPPCQRGYRAFGSIHEYGCHVARDITRM